MPNKTRCTEVRDAGESDADLGAGPRGGEVLVVVAGTGGAVAGRLVTSAQIKNHTIRGADVHAHTLHYNHLTRGAQKKLRGAKGAPGSSLGWITVVGANGFVSAHGGTLAEPSVTHPRTGVYCIAGPGWGSAGAYVVSANVSNEGQLAYRASVDVDGSDCGGGLEVLTAEPTAPAESHDLGFTLVRVG